MGLILWELLNRKLPFIDEVESELRIPEYVMAGGRPLLPEAIAATAYGSLIKACWSQSPLSRPTFDSVLCQLRRAFEEESLPLPPSFEKETDTNSPMLTFSELPELASPALSLRLTQSVRLTADDSLVGIEGGGPMQSSSSPSALHRNSSVASCIETHQSHQLPTKLQTPLLTNGIQLAYHLARDISLPFPATSSKASCSSCSLVFGLLDFSRVCDSCGRGFCQNCIPGSKGQSRCFACTADRLNAAAMAERLPTMRVQVMCLVGNSLIWIGFRNGRVTIANLTQGSSRVLFRPDARHLPKQAVNSLVLQQQTTSYVWSGSCDGLLQCWPSVPQRLDQALAQSIFRGNVRLSTVFTALDHLSGHSWKPAWMVLQGTQLQFFSNAVVGPPELCLRIGEDVSHATLVKATVVLYAGRAGRLHVETADPEDAPHLFELVFRTLSLRRNADSAPYVVCPKAQRKLPLVELTALATINNDVWSASSELVLRRWRLKLPSETTGLYGRAEIECVEQISLTTITELPPSPRIVTIMPIAKHMLVAIGPMLFTLSLAQDRCIQHVAEITGRDIIVSLLVSQVDVSLSEIDCPPVVWVCDLSGFIRIIDSNSLSLVHSFRLDTNVFCLCPIYYGRAPSEIFAGTASGNILRIAKDTYQLTACSLPVHSQPIVCIAQDNSRVFTGSWDETLSELSLSLE